MQSKIRFNIKEANAPAHDLLRIRQHQFVFDTALATTVVGVLPTSAPVDLGDPLSRLSCVGALLSSRRQLESWVVRGCAKEDSRMCVIFGGHVVNGTAKTYLRHRS